jgi:hypothetical protein
MKDSVLQLWYSKKRVKMGPRPWFGWEGQFGLGVVAGGSAFGGGSGPASCHWRMLKKGNFCRT